ncbi:MAG: GGDEF domain-containing protein [Pseudomonadota bacterium]|nr:GGDEF domain-containing protein [Pseudomonadota bacterium]
MTFATRLVLPPGLLEAAENLAPKHARLEAALERFRTSGGSADATLDLELNFGLFDSAAMRALVDAMGDVDQQSAVARLLRGIAASRRSELDEALVLLPPVALEARLELDERLLAWTLSEWGRASAMKGERLRAFELVQECLLLTRTLEWPEHEALTLCHLGLLYGQEGESEPYAAYTRQALTLYRELGDSQGITQCLVNLGGALTTLRELDEAARCYAEALLMAHASGWAYLEALALAGRGGLRFQEGDVDEGLVDYRASAVLLEARAQHFQLTRHDLLVGRHLLRANRGVEAMEWARSCLARAESYGFDELKAGAHELLSSSLSLLGRHEEAVGALRTFCDLREQRVQQQVADAQRGAEQAQHELLTRKQAQWERERGTELQAKNDELAVALAAQEQLRAELEQVSRTDPLTGLANRREMDRYLCQAVAQAGRSWRPLSFVLLDVDHFKQVNDRFGHAGGDAVLVELARRLRERMRASDLLARWGGEEFCMILPDTVVAGAFTVAERVRRLVADTPFLVGNELLKVTISLGVANLEPGRCEAVRLLQAADEALYAAKRAGRNRIGNPLRLPVPPRLGREPL